LSRLGPVPGGKVPKGRLNGSCKPLASELPKRQRRCSYQPRATPWGHGQDSTSPERANHLLLSAACPDDHFVKFPKFVSPFPALRFFSLSSCASAIFTRSLPNFTPLCLSFPPDILLEWELFPFSLWMTILSCARVCGRCWKLPMKLPSRAKPGTA